MQDQEQKLQIAISREALCHDARDTTSTQQHIPCIMVTLSFFSAVQDGKFDEVKSQVEQQKISINATGIFH
jgi:hypothetical protein